MREGERALSRIGAMYKGTPCVIARSRDEDGRYLTEAPTVSRFWQWVSKSQTCWNWTGYIDEKGYGRLVLSGQKQYIRVHRYSYEIHNGPIPERMTIDHLCRNRKCVNPVHLEAVTAAVNTLRGFGAPAVNGRKGECIHGHPFTPENTFKQWGGGRGCLACNRQYQREWARAKRARDRDGNSPKRTRP